MKKMLITLGMTLAFVALAACGEGGNGGVSADDRTMAHFVQAFLDAGFEITTFDLNMQMVAVTEIADMDTPFYSMIDAIDGVLFYFNLSPVTIYEYADIAALEQAFVDFGFMNAQGWVANGRFVIETNIQEINSFFGGID